jgi:superfamily II DNA or RNA helicase
VQLGDDYDPLVSSNTYRGFPLRRWQQEALEVWEESDHCGVVEAITGTGKSLLGIAAIHHTVVRSGGKALLLVPTKALLEQWSRLVVQSLPSVRVGRLTSGSADNFRSSDVIISTVQTAWKSPPIPISLGLLVADEVHRYGSEHFSQALHQSYQRRLGLTGTFERQLDDGVDRFLLPYFRSVTTSYGYALALKEDVVAPFDLAFVAAEFSSTERRAYEEASVRCSDAQTELIGNFGYPADWPQFFAEVTRRLNNDMYQDDESGLCATYMSGFAEKRRLTAEAAAKESFVGKLAASFQSFSGSLVFTETKESARRLGWIIDRVTPAFPLTSDSSSAEREDKLRAFSAGRIKVLCAPRILDEGVDVPEAEVAIIVAASKTARQMIQRMGRVIRRKADGRSARIVIMYIKGTGEDPELGGHEAFLNTVRPFARSELMTSVESPETLIDWLRARPSVIDEAVAVSANKPPPPKVSVSKYNLFDVRNEQAKSEGRIVGTAPYAEGQGLLDGAQRKASLSGAAIKPDTNAYQIESYRAFSGKLAPSPHHLKLRLFAMR